MDRSILGVACRINSKVIPNLRPDFIRLIDCVIRKNHKRLPSGKYSLGANSTLAKKMNPLLGKSSPETPWLSFDLRGASSSLSLSSSST